jgi:hypothetical protein
MPRLSPQLTGVGRLWEPDRVSRQWSSSSATRSSAPCGRGSSGDTQPYAAEREIEDLQALIGETGGSASLYGVSSGQRSRWRRQLAARASRSSCSTGAPFTEDESRAAASGEYSVQLNRLIAAATQSDALSTPRIRWVTLAEAARISGLACCRPTLRAISSTGIPWPASLVSRPAEWGAAHRGWLCRRWWRARPRLCCRQRCRAWSCAVFCRSGSWAVRR